jgi:hypothetical protein
VGAARLAPRRKYRRGTIQPPGCGQTVGEGKTKEAAKEIEMERGVRAEPIAPQPSEGSDERSIKELIERLGEQTQALARQEVELAKAEVTEKGKRLGIGAGAFGAAGIVGLFALGALTAAFVLLLATAMDAWVAALIVAAAYAAIAGIAALAGRSQVQRGTPPAPERAIDSTKEDIEAVKRSAREGRA